MVEFGDYIYEDCKSLNTVTFNDSISKHITEIPFGMFKGCTSLKSLNS